MLWPTYAGEVGGDHELLAHVGHEAEHDGRPVSCAPVFGGKADEQGNAMVHARQRDIDQSRMAPRQLCPAC